jgi:hypothetical protein
MSLALGVAAILIAHAGAVMVPPGERTGLEAGEETEAREAREARVNALAWRYGVTDSQIQGMLDSGLDWGTVETALGIAQRAKRPVTEVLRLRDEGLPFAEVARRYGLDPEDAVRRDLEAEALRDAVRARPAPPRRDVQPKKTAPKRPATRSQPQPKTDRR